MTRKSVVAVVMSALMILSTSLPAYADTVVTEQGESGIELFGTPDYNAPVLESVSVDKTEVQAGESFTITCLVNDDLSGFDFGGITVINEVTQKAISTEHIHYEVKDLSNLHYEIAFTIDVPADETIGALRLESVTLFDFANNRVVYHNSDDEHPLPSYISVQVTNSNSEDKAAPMLNSLSIAPREISASETTALTLNVSDDISGVSYVTTEFVNRDTGHSIEAGWNSYNSNPVVNGEITVQVNTTQYDGSGIYELDRVALMDANGFMSDWYSINNPNYDSSPLPQEISFTISNDGNEDITPPVLNSVSLDKTEVEAPDVVTVTLDVTDDVSGYRSGLIRFVNRQNGKRIESNTDSDNPSVVQIEVSQFEPSGIFELEDVYLFDNNNNMSHYISHTDTGSDTSKFPNEVSFLVKNTDEDSNTIVTSTTSENLVSSIKNMQEGGTAYIYHGNNNTLPAGVFEAIKGQNKTIVVESDGIQWIFNGTDITGEIKDIDLSTAIDTKWNIDSEADDVMDWEQNAIILKFADNDQLPGEATIRVKMDYVFRDYLGSDEGLYVYYFDNTTQQFVEVAANISVGNDDYLEFTIDHNSEFVITAGEIKVNETNPPVNPDDDNEDIQPPVIEDDTTKPSTPSGSTSSNRPSVSTNANRDISASSSSRKNVAATNNWNQLKADIEDAIESAQPTTFKVQLGSDEMLPASVLKAMQGHDITIEIALANGEDVVLNGLALTNIKTGFYTSAALQELGNYVVAESAEENDVVESNEPSVAEQESNEAQVAKPNPETGAADAPFASLMLAVGCAAAAVVLTKKK